MTQTYAFPTGDFVASTLNGALTAGATSATIGTGLTIPATNGILHLDHDSTTAVGVDDGPETISYTSYTTGTGALAGITRGLGWTTGVAHANGAKVAAGLSAHHFTSNSTLPVEVLYNPYKARAYRSGSNQTISDSVSTKVQLNSESYDINSNFDSTTNYRYTAPVSGYYDIKGSVLLQGAAGSISYTALIYKNGSQVTAGSNLAVGAVVGRSNVSDVLYLAANDYIELWAYADASSGSITVTAGDGETYLSIHLLSV